MKPSEREIMEMLGYAALGIRSPNPVSGKQRINCWCWIPREKGHSAECRTMSAAVKAWRDRRD